MSFFKHDEKPSPDEKDHIELRNENILFYVDLKRGGSITGQDLTFKDRNVGLYIWKNGVWINTLVGSGLCSRSAPENVPDGSPDIFTTDNTPVLWYEYGDNWAEIETRLVTWDNGNYFTPHKYYGHRMRRRYTLNSASISIEHRYWIDKNDREVSKQWYPNPKKFQMWSAAMDIRDDMQYFEWNVDRAWEIKTRKEIIPAPQTGHIPRPDGTQNIEDNNGIETLLEFTKSKTFMIYAPNNLGIIRQLTMWHSGQSVHPDIQDDIEAVSYFANPETSAVETLEIYMLAGNSHWMSGFNRDYNRYIEGFVSIWKEDIHFGVMHGNKFISLDEID